MKRSGPYSRLAVAALALADQDHARPRRGRILVVADEELLLRTYARCLRRTGTEVVTACGGRAALAVLARDADFDVVVCAPSRPDLDGVPVLAWIDEHAPELAPRVLFVGDGTPPRRVRDLVKHAVLVGPVTMSALRAAVDELMRAPRPDAHG